MTKTKPNTRFRCKTCHTGIHNIDEKEHLFLKPLLPYHSECEIEYFTESQYSELGSNVTQIRHDRIVRYSQKWFEHKARIINKIGYPFSRDDFPELKGPTFRKKVERCGTKVTRVIGGNWPSYRFVDIETGFERPDVTLLGMRVGLEFEKILVNTKLQYPKLHDIKLTFKSDDLFTYIKENYDVNPNNGGIKLCRMQLAQDIYAIVTAYPKSVNIDIGCTFSGIIYDFEGAMRFLMMLGVIRSNLFILSKSKANLPDPTSWVVTHYHFNKDSQIGYSGKSFHIEAKEVAGGFVRFYSKRFPDGKKARLEQAKTPHKTVKEEVETMKKVSNYVYDNEGERCTAEEARKILNFGDAPQNDEKPIWIKMTGKELLKSPDWEKFSNEPKHVIQSEEGIESGLPQ